MVQGKKKYGLTDFLSGYFGNIGTMLLVNLLFCIPLAVFSGILWALFYLTGVIDILVLLLLIPLLSPFVTGMGYVCRKLTTESAIHPAADFIKGVRQNWKFSLVNGIIVYIVTSGLYVTFAYFREHLNDITVMVYLIFSALVTLFFICVELSLGVMAVSVELKAGELIKNAVMLVLPGFWQHIKTLIWYLFIAAVLFSLVVMINHTIAVLVMLAVLTLLLLPTLLTHIAVYNAYQTVEKIIIIPYQKNAARQKAQQEQQKQEQQITIEQLEELAKGNPDEYVSLAGRMVKRRTVLKMLETKRRM